MDNNYRQMKKNLWKMNRETLIQANEEKLKMREEGTWFQPKQEPLRVLTKAPKTLPEWETQTDWWDREGNYRWPKNNEN